MNADFDKRINLNHTEQAYSAWVYLILLALAEVVTVFVSPLLGSVLYFLIAIILVFHAALKWRRPLSRFLISLALAPLMRVIGLTLFLNYGNLIWQVFLVCIPMFLAICLVRRQLGLTWQEIGLRFDNWRRILLIGSSGLVIGCLQYLVTRHRIGIPASWYGMIFWIVVLLGAGFLEELIFRGLIQKTAISRIGVWPGITFVALLLAVFQIAELSPAHLIFVYLMGMGMGWVFYRTDSILGVALAHGLANLVFYLVIPIVLI